MGIACAGKEGRACFTCRANRRACDYSHANSEKSHAGTSDKEQDSVSGVAAGRLTKKHARSKSNLETGGKEKEVGEKEDGEKENAAASEVIEGSRASRPRQIGRAHV